MIFCTNLIMRCCFIIQTEEASIAELNEMRRQRAEQARAKRAASATGAFDKDLSGGGGKKAPRMAAERKPHKEFEFKEKITNYKRHANKRGTTSFKSKKKYQRRK